MENKKTYKKWNNNTKSQRRKEELKETVKGFLLFTDKNKEKNALRDAFNILNDTVDELYPTLLDDEQNKKEISTNNDTLNNLEAELTKLKQNKKLFYNFNTGCKGVVFIRIAKEYADKISPKDIINHLLLKVTTSKELLSKNISKFIPVEIGFLAKIDVFKEEVKKLIEKYFVKDEKKEGKTFWTIEFRHRNNTSISKTEYCDYIINLVDKEKYYLNYKKPELTVLVEITNDFCCMSVLEKYFEYKCYNFQTLAKTEEERNKEREKLMKMQKEKELEKEKAKEVKVENKEEHTINTIQKEEEKENSDDDDIQII